jgi:hypothetical protein
VLVFDVGPDETSFGKIVGFLRAHFLKLPAVPQIPDWVDDHDSIITIDCPITGIHTLKLGLSIAHKWRLAMQGFEAIVRTLAIRRNGYALDSSGF